ncbi:uncharacterized protein L969DRAFT_20298 [Mixia osmundae IAM 14324]|uniref:Prephenate dehydrogenase [NADP(+)] n=1 Tax=Mixia osmundae (strain CBS 9802 / IAM 14324 / JCM 22182 / KY 12970) TaxID=764103 RepID=G7EB63_MIXOS|nr:uncharacterized protein L969DRAFT_20298 [Mixia osmundae IAM 14324]KEI36559.1 hypothetical protein L969DRAFT_20298 [Mixia osmundae IAM 14324]GAB00074.1 hypothetical protein E5Q_06776 [Mixia osmundae IAM 14324]
MNLPALRDVQVGIIGMGEMGKMYARQLAKAGHVDRINVCDRPERYETLAKEMQGQGLSVMKDGHHVARTSDFIIYSVEAEFINSVVAQYGPSSKIGAIVAGQTSVKAPERAAFEAHLPQDVSIVSVHSLHGPSVPSEGQALIIIQHRGTEAHRQLVEDIMAPLKSRHVHLSYEDHDLVTANTQAVTHAAFLSMGTAWNNMGRFPWQTGRYIGGIEVAKINIALRIYGQKWHVYAGLAILNPAAQHQIRQYAKSASDLFKLMIEERVPELRERIFRARDYIFPPDNAAARPLFLSDTVFDQFAIGSKTSGYTPPLNSHLSLLAMVDCWQQLKIQPFKHLELAATPVFRLWFGVVEYLFRDEARLEQAIQAGAKAKTHASDDCEFVVAARGWSQCVDFQSFSWYQHRFEETSNFFAGMIEESNLQGANMLKEILSQRP